MSNKFQQPGHCLTAVAPSGGVTSGTPLLLGVIVGIPTTSADEGANYEACISGVHSVPKADSQAWTVGAQLYWDDTAKAFTTTATSNTAAGIAWEAVASTAGLTTGKVLLNGLPCCTAC